MSSILREMRGGTEIKKQFSVGGYCLWRALLAFFGLMIGCVEGWYSADSGMLNVAFFIDLAFYGVASSFFTVGIGPTL